MKHYKLALFLVILALMLSACSSGGAAPAGGAEGSFTAAAQTVFAAQTAAALPASTTLPTYTPVTQMSLTPTRTITPIPSATRPAVTVASTCDNSAYVSDVTIPDGTVIAPGGSFTKTWSIRNTGTCDWSTAYALAFLSGSAMDGSTTKLSASVSAGDAVNISVGMYAPMAAGTYTGYWRMQNAVGTFFGEAVFVKIVVSSGTVTISVTPTNTGTASSLTSTSTPSPVNTPTSTETPTETTVPDTPTETPT
ncbi:MAG: NBR1-Ig-like domain-containing protein [Anaerolineales bacterium]